MTTGFKAPELAGAIDENYRLHVDAFFPEVPGPGPGSAAHPGTGRHWRSGVAASRRQPYFRFSSGSRGGRLLGYGRKPVSWPGVSPFSFPPRFGAAHAGKAPTMSEPLLANLFYEAASGDQLLLRALPLLL